MNTEGLKYLRNVADEVSEKGYDYYEALNVAECIIDRVGCMHDDVYRVIAVLEGEI